MLRTLAAALAAILLLAVPAEARRVALVIGNASYAIGPLTNPVNDADAVAKALKDLGFEDVVLSKNLGGNAMRDAIKSFGARAAGADIAVVYFAGHGTEVGGRNYLIPIDARLARGADLDFEAISLDTVISQVDGARKLRLVILDACRNNIFPLAGAKRSLSRGLARVEPEDNTLIAYAAKDGSTADDGTGRHSPYTTALLKHLGTPNLDVRIMFGRVRDDVLSLTRREQQPHLYGTLGGEQIFLSSSATSAAPPPVAPSRPAAPSEAPRPDSRELVAAIASMTDRAVLETFARHHDESIRRAATARLASLSPPPASTPARPPTPAVPGPPAAYQLLSRKPVVLIVPFAAGSSTDIVARALATSFQGVAWRNVIVENIGGASGLAGLDRAARAAADGNTLVVTSTGPVAIGPATGMANAAETERKLAHVVILATGPGALVVRDGGPVWTFDDLGSRPKGMGITVGIAGTLSFAHLALEEMRRLGGITVTTIPYRGAVPAMTDVKASVIDAHMMFPLQPPADLSALGLRAIAVTSRARSAFLPDVPTFDELGLRGYDLVSFMGIAAPAGTPRPVLDALNRAFRSALSSAGVASALSAAGHIPVALDVDQTTAFVQKEIDTWTAVARASSIKAQ